MPLLVWFEKFNSERVTNNVTDDYDDHNNNNDDDDETTTKQQQRKQQQSLDLLCDANLFVLLHLRVMNVNVPITFKRMQVLYILVCLPLKNNGLLNKK